MGADELWDGRDDADPTTGASAAGARPGGPLEPVRRRRLGGGISTALVAAGLVALVVHGQRQDAGSAHDTTHRTVPPVVLPQPETAFVEPDATLPPDDQLPDLAVTKLCPATVHPSGALSVSFVLTNPGRRPVPVLDVIPLLPLQGLRPVGRRRTHGDCTHDLGRPLDQLVASGASLRVTFDFAAPAGCPAALPVQATVRIRRQDHAVDQRLPVYSDLSALNLPACR